MVGRMREVGRLRVIFCLLKAVCQMSHGWHKQNSHIFETLESWVFLSSLQAKLSIEPKPLEETNKNANEDLLLEKHAIENSLIN